MKVSQVAQLLALAQSFDRREYTEVQVRAWALVVGDLDYALAERAVVEHYKRSRFPIMPADVVVLVSEFSEITARDVTAERMREERDKWLEAAGISLTDWQQAIFEGLTEEALEQRFGVKIRGEISE
ncbi:hypothetical protein [Lysinibacter sp. HNR]|uniref:hypothetical protein n=1 Tax=Lysinibacter sp. HNR TaxID=3031408 RepID=UPI002435CC43|nr:hypothetical protein [Lysinibacter sp. HNR]WGD38494.1 hypothetical protein FrondiHNR_06175 [Lysinibacter sp. HNR]